MPPWPSARPCRGAVLIAYHVLDGKLVAVSSIFESLKVYGVRSFSPLQLSDDQRAGGVEEKHVEAISDTLVAKLPSVELGG